MTVNDRAVCADDCPGRRDRLVPVSAAGATEREYRTEQESFTKIVAYGMQDGVPDSFKVWTKDGRTPSYGATVNARMPAFRLHATDRGRNGEEQTQPHAIPAPPHRRLLDRYRSISTDTGQLLTAKGV